jgi:hypothetical protein
MKSRLDIPVKMGNISVNYGLRGRMLPLVRLLTLMAENTMRLSVRPVMAICAMLSLLPGAADAKALSIHSCMACCVRSFCNSVQAPTPGASASHYSATPPAEKIGPPKVVADAPVAAAPRGNLVARAGDDGWADMATRRTAWNDANPSDSPEQVQRVTVLVNGNYVMLEIRVVSVTPAPGPKPPAPTPTTNTDLAKRLKGALNEDKNKATDAERTTGLKSLSGTYGQFALILGDPNANKYTPKQIADLVKAHLQNEKEALKLTATLAVIDAWLNDTALSGVDPNTPLSQTNKDKLAAAFKELQSTLLLVP